MRRAVHILVIGVIAVLVMAPGTAAAGTYPSGAIGYDVSYPQCGGLPASPGSFAVVGVTGGRAFSQNSCLAGEFAWAAKASTPPTLYTNLNYAVGSTAGNGSSGPYGANCKRNTACFAQNYGWNAAHAAYTYASGQGATAAVWWLDIETANSWSSNAALNQATIQGAIACLAGTGPGGASCTGAAPSGITVGIYSTPGMWHTITGGWYPGVVANWVAGASSQAAAASYCGSGTPLYSGGAVWLVQYPVGNYDGDYAC
jgi:hypothetical protein